MTEKGRTRECVHPHATLDGRRECARDNPRCPHPHNGSVFAAKCAAARENADTGGDRG